MENLAESEKAYYGPSFGAGIKLRSLRYRGPYWDFSLLVPVRSQSFRDDHDFYAKSPSVNDFTKALPVLFSIGYNFQISAQK